MNTRAGESSSFDTAASFTRGVLALAAEVEAAKTTIKAELLRAARAGDCGTVIGIVER